MIETHLPAASAPREPGPSPLKAGAGTGTTAAIRDAATRFEGVFLAEMLKHTGLARPPEGFGGGPGEAQFAPLLVRAYADALADRGGVGLADHVAEAMMKRLP